MPETLTLASTSSSLSGYGLLQVIRSSLGSESWQRNHTWTAKAEWEHRRQGFPLARDLRWRFAKNWNATFEKDETAVPIDAPASAVKRPAAAPSKPATGDTSESPTKSATADSKIDSSTASSKKEAEKASDKPSQPEGPA